MGHLFAPLALVQLPATPLTACARQHPARTVPTSKQTQQTAAAVAQRASQQLPMRAQHVQQDSVVTLAIRASLTATGSALTLALTS
jgi:hypothetical protein